MKLKYLVIERFRGKYSVEAMCQVFGVSRSGERGENGRAGRQRIRGWLI